MQVLFTSHGAYGHVLAVMGVARAAAAQGHDVRIATGERFGETVRNCGLTAEAAGMDDEAVVAEAHRRWPETIDQPPAEWTTKMFCHIAAPAMAADLGPIISRWRPDVIVREQGEFGGPIAAAAAGVPWLTHAWGSPLPAAAALAELCDLLCPLWEGAGLSASAESDLFGAAVLDPCPPSLYPARPAIANRHAVRPVSPRSSPERVPAPRAPTQLAYVGFGTVPLFRDAPDLTRATVDVLLAHGIEVVVTTGAELKMDLGRAGDGRVKVERWVDLSALLPRCSLVVCHGGAGTTLAALSAGVPLLLLPRGAPSQLRMSAACVARGVGRSVEWDGTNAEEIHAAVSDLTSIDDFGEAAAEVAGEIAAMPDPSHACELLVDVATGRA